MGLLFPRTSGFAPCKWQENPEPLRESQIVVRCVDIYKGREELEIARRRYLMHYIDMGMDVHGKEPPVIGGQVILSSPGGLCMRCMGFLTDEKLAQEAARYGDAGGRPQVIWPNGILASTHQRQLAWQLIWSQTGRESGVLTLTWCMTETTARFEIVTHSGTRIPPAGIIQP